MGFNYGDKLAEATNFFFVEDWLLVGMRLQNLPRKKPYVKGISNSCMIVSWLTEPYVKGISNSCMIDGWLTDIKLRTLDVSTCLGCWFIQKSGPGLKIEKALRTISKFILTCAAQNLDASGQNQIVKDLTHDQDLFIKTIWLQEKFFNMDTTLYQFKINSGN